MDEIVTSRCRNCQECVSSRTESVERFTCRRGYFDFTRYGDGRTEGQLPGKGNPRAEIPCGGKDFFPFAGQRPRALDESDELLI
jgi:hypothetical protein